MDSGFTRTGVGVRVGAGSWSEPRDPWETETYLTQRTERTMVHTNVNNKYLCSVRHHATSGVRYSVLRLRSGFVGDPGHGCPWPVPCRQG